MRSRTAGLLGILASLLIFAQSSLADSGLCPSPTSASLKAAAARLSERAAGQALGAQKDCALISVRSGRALSTLETKISRLRDSIVALSRKRDGLDNFLSNPITTLTPQERGKLEARLTALTKLLIQNKAQLARAIAEYQTRHALLDQKLQSWKDGLNTKTARQKAILEAAKTRLIDAINQLIAQFPNDPGLPEALSAAQAIDLSALDFVCQ